MDWTKTTISATIDFDAEGKHTGDLRLPWSGNEKPLGYHPVPVAVIKNGTGPTLLLAGGTHGDEYEGPAALMQLLHSLDPVRLQGRLIIFPALNAPAVTAGARCSPLDDGNLNRAFPGNRTGGPTNMIARFIEDVVLPECDAAIDFHSGGNAYLFAPLAMVYLGAKSADNTSLELARAFNAPYLWSGRFAEQSTFNAAAMRRDIPMFATELGGGGNVHPHMAQLAADGLLRVLRHLGMLDDTAGVPAAGNAPTNVEVSVNGKLHATTEGLFVPAVTLEQPVKPGDAAGKIYSVTELERAPSTFHFVEDGIVLSVVNRGMVNRGDLLVMAGKISSRD
ncbi:MAG: succinylglutamate desuccinylase/aspartoacylase family protein [Gammaproteobacteria bacterium]|nr:succinylglutamate desuccinylase/aspartoacylase family protein [Gammaproteobacteria bacterium]